MHSNSHLPRCCAKMRGDVFGNHVIKILLSKGVVNNIVGYLTILHMIKANYI